MAFNLTKYFKSFVCLSFLFILSANDVFAGEKWGCVHTVRYSLDGEGGGLSKINTPETFEWLSNKEIKVLHLTYLASGGVEEPKHFANNIGSVFVDKKSYPYTVIVAEADVGNSFRVDYLRCKP